MSKPREDFEKEWTNDETHIIVMRCISSSSNNNGWKCMYFQTYIKFGDKLASSLLIVVAR